MRFVLGIFLILALTATGWATDGYHFRGGYYYYGNESQAYYRTLITTPGYFRYGVYYPASSYYSYQAYTPPATPTQTYNQPGDFRVELLKIAERQSKLKGKLLLDAAEQKSFLEGIKALGLEGSLGYGGGYQPGFGTVPPYLLNNYGAGSYQHSVVNFGANASTQYGYSLTNAMQQIYGSNDPNVALQLLGQYLNNSMALTDKAAAGVQGLATDHEARKAKQANDALRVHLALEAIKSLGNSPSIETKTLTFNSTTGQTSGNQNTQPKAFGVQGGVDPRWKLSADARCARCHSGANPKGAFNVYTFSAMTEDAKQVVRDRLTTTDDKQRMPPGENGTIGLKLPPEELSWWGVK